MSNELQKAPEKQDIRGLITSEQMRGKIAEVLPKYLTAEQMTRVMAGTIARVPKLAECTTASLLNALMLCAQAGILPDGRNAHLLPFKCYNKELECNEMLVQVIFDYKGLIQIAERNGVQNIRAIAVHEKDVFEYGMEGANVTFKWKPDSIGDRGKLVAFAATCIRDGNTDVEVMTKDEVDAIRKRSKASSSGPWVTDYAEMGKKGLALDTPIPTTSGWTTMGEIQKGDVVFDMHGNPSEVLDISEIKQIQCFRVNFANGESIVCDDEHRWVARIGNSDAHRHTYKTHTVNEIYEAKLDGLSVTIPMQGVLETPEAELPIDPYILGYWLGDGTSRAASITCGEPDRDHVVGIVEKSKYSLGKIGVDKRNGVLCVRVKNGLLEDLRALGVLSNKHVPSIYLRASANQRLSLLAGLMDSDGHLDKERGRAHFCNKNKRLADAVAELVSTLGDSPQVGMQKINGFGVTCDAHIVKWKPSICPCRLPRKAANFKARKIAKYRGIASVEMVATVPTKCIAVSGDTKTYLAGRSMCTTHNTVLRRMSKRWPLSPEQAAALDTEAKAETIPVQSVHVPKFSESEVTKSIFGTPEKQLAEIKDSEKTTDTELADHDLM